jgi:hypothetical protein
MKIVGKLTDLEAVKIKMETEDNWKKQMTWKKIIRTVIAFLIGLLIASITYAAVASISKDWGVAKHLWWIVLEVTLVTLYWYFCFRKIDPVEYPCSYQYFTATNGKTIVKEFVKYCVDNEHAYVFTKSNSNYGETEQYIGEFKIALIDDASEPVLDLTQRKLFVPCQHTDIFFCNEPIFSNVKGDG